MRKLIIICFLFLAGCTDNSINSNLTDGWQLFYERNIKDTLIKGELFLDTTNSTKLIYNTQIRLKIIYRIDSCSESNPFFVLRDSTYVHNVCGMYFWNTAKTNLDTIFSINAKNCFNIFMGASDTKFYFDSLQIFKK